MPEFCPLAQTSWRKFRRRELLMMIEDKVGKLFVMIFTNGDLPKNPMMLSECVVCGGSVHP